MKNVVLQKSRRASAAQDAILARRADVARLRNAGMRMEAIARELNVSVATVSRDCDVLRSEWRARAAGKYDDLLAAELEQLVSVRQHAWQGFEESKNPLRPEGCNKMLELVRKSTADIVKLLGIDDPVAFNAKRVSGDDESGLSVDVVEIVVQDRGELADLRDEAGNISFTAFRARMEEDLQRALAVQQRQADQQDTGDEQGDHAQ